MDKNQDDKDRLLNDILNESSRMEKKGAIESEPLPYGAEDIASDTEYSSVRSESGSGRGSKHRKGGKKNKKKRFRPWILVLATFIIIIAVGCATVILHIGKELFGIDKSDDQITVKIPSGANTSDIAGILKENGVIQYPLLFRFISRTQGADAYYKEGEHDLRFNMPYEVIITELQKESARATVNITFPEGLTLVECAQILEKGGVCGAEEFLTFFNEKDQGYNFEKLVEANELRPFKLEGCAFPDTYRFFKDSEVSVVSQKIKSNFAEKVNPNMIGRMKDIDISFQDALILASIVQLEAPSAKEMKNVASVFWNRINNPDMFQRLESDPTKKYITRSESGFKTPATQEMVDAYDTYVGKGLPPGPICNPGITAVEAVLYPSDTNYYYFCSNLKTGEFFYAKTLKEHEANLRTAGLR